MADRGGLRGMGPWRMPQWISWKMWMIRSKWIPIYHRSMKYCHLGWRDYQPLLPHRPWIRDSGLTWLTLSLPIDWMCVWRWTVWRRSSWSTIDIFKTVPDNFCSQCSNLCRGTIRYRLFWRWNWAWRIDGISTRRIYYVHSSNSSSKLQQEMPSRTDLTLSTYKKKSQNVSFVRGLKTDIFCEDMNSRTFENL